MTTRITAAVLDRPGGSFRLEELTLDDPRPNEVLVRIVATGVCCTDASEQHRVPTPVVLGHEGAGVVERVGSHVTTIRPGDHVVLTFASCGVCTRCHQDRPYHCERMGELHWRCRRADGTPTLARDGGSVVHGAYFQQSSFATHALATERNAIVVSKDAPLELLGPLGCGIQTGAGAIMNTLEARAGDRVAIFGAGAVGLSGVMAAMLVGANVIAVVDVVPERLALARALGATHTIDAAEGDVVEQVVAATGGGADIVLEASGSGNAFSNAVASMAMGGTCGFVVPPIQEPAFALDPADLMAKCGRLEAVSDGSSVPRKFIPHLVELFLEGRFPIDRLASFYRIAEIGQAFADSRNGRAVKPILRMT